jgi:hypothetical protein
VSTEVVFSASFAISSVSSLLPRCVPLIALSPAIVHSTLSSKTLSAASRSPALKAA